MMLGSDGGASITTRSSGGRAHGQSSGRRGGRGPGSSLGDLLSSPPELSGGIYGGCSEGRGYHSKPSSSTEYHGRFGADNRQVERLGQSPYISLNAEEWTAQTCNSVH